MTKEPSIERVSSELVVEPAPHVTGSMTKDLLMKYTFVALSILAAIAIYAFGIAALIMEIIAVVVAIGCDYLLSLVMKKKGPANTYSAAVSGLIVALSFSSGIPYALASPNYMMEPNMQYVAVAGISALAVIVFKKLQGLLGRKFVNPAAAAKLLILAPIYTVALIPSDHLSISIATWAGLKSAVTELCFGYSPDMAGYINAQFSNPYMNLVLLKSHGWMGGASSIAVIAVGIALIILCRNYIKWRIPLTFLVTMAIISAGYGFFNGDDVLLRMAFHIFVGSSIFLAFFMATDPATSPLTGLGQITFSVGVAVITFVLQIWANFFGASILALVIMNLTVPLLDRMGIHKSFGRS
jgi:electron transport complex protein RnfD